jgi:hypothetical protein
MLWCRTVVYDQTKYAVERLINPFLQFSGDGFYPFFSGKCDDLGQVSASPFMGRAWLRFKAYVAHR